MTAPLLGLLGLTFSVFVPRALARAAWPARVPRSAVLLWQSVTLASVLSAVGVVLAAPEQIVRATDSGRAVSVSVLIATLAVAGLIVLRLLVSLGLVMTGSRARRARHRLLVDLLDQAERHGDLDLVCPGGSLRVLDGAVPFAYCLPGRSPRVVVSGGALKVLAPAQVAAVLAHEQAHLRFRHDLVLEAFLALYRALPRRLRSRTSLDAVHLLLEMLADDAARRRYGAEPLRAALTALSWDPAPGSDGSDSSGSSDGSDSSDGGRRNVAHETRARLERLGEGARASSTPLGLFVDAVAVGVLVLPTVVVVVPWLTQAFLNGPLG